MRCLKRDFKPGAIFHIYNHAIDDYQLFYDDIDYNYMINIFEENIEKIPSSIIAFCLMPDHYHFLIRQDSEVEIYKLFNYSFIRYAKYFNEKYSRKGPIFRSPLQHILVADKTYMIQLCKYIHLNPVRKDLVDQPENWIYSNYKNWLFQNTDKLTINNVFKELSITPSWYKTYLDSPFNFICSKIFSKWLNINLSH